MTETATGTRQFSSASLGAVIAGRYRLLNLIGEGGMGQVFEAEHLALGRPFALKVLRLEKWSDELVARFQREARALARIESPRVAQVTDYGVEENVGPYYVMELVRGETLEHRIGRSSGVRVDEALHIAAESAEALGEVHDCGIVHRDVKPSNLGLPATGPVAVKLLDFGLAASIDDSFMQRLTKSQQVLGSLPYMAPEQFHGARPQPQMDIYAIGVVLFEMLAGQLPFKAPSTAALIHQILASPVPSFDQVAPAQQIPPRVEQVVRRLLGKDPADRFASAREAAAAIRQTAEGSLASTLPGHQELPRTRYQPEVVLADMDDSSAPTSSPHADTVAVPTSTPSGQQPPDTEPTPEAPATGAVPPQGERGWPSGQVVPPTSYPAEARARGRGATIALLLGGGVLLGALTAVAIVLALQSGATPTDPQPAGAAPTGPGGPAGVEAAAGGEVDPPSAAEAIGADAGTGAVPQVEQTEQTEQTEQAEQAEQAGGEPAARRTEAHAETGHHARPGRPRAEGGGPSHRPRTTMRSEPHDQEPSAMAPTAMASTAGEGESGGSEWQGEVIEQPEF